MLKYDDYLFSCWLISGSQAPTNFSRTTFDYGARQRRSARGTIRYTVKIIATEYETNRFVSFWEAIGQGTDTFLTDQVIHANTKLDKEVRFTSGYTIQELGSSTYSITVPLEIIKMESMGCLLAPGTFQLIGDGLTPCGE